MSKRESFAADILEVAGDEPIEAIEISEDDYTFKRRPELKIAPEMLDRPLSWNEAKPLLDYEYDDGFGSQSCHDFNAWTPTRVLFVHEYDGSTCIVSVPRNPEPGGR